MEVFKTETKIGLNKDKRTLSRKVFEYLYNDILFLKLKPGQLIKEKEISTKLDVSRTPIREALLKLEDEGLVEIYPQRGTYISKISIESVYESHFIRESIEIANVKNAIEYGTVDFFKELITSFLSKPINGMNLIFLLSFITFSINVLLLLGL